MFKRISFDEFETYFNRTGRGDQFSTEALRALFDYVLIPSFTGLRLVCSRRIPVPFQPFGRAVAGETRRVGVNIGHGSIVVSDGAIKGRGGLRQWQEVQPFVEKLSLGGPQGSAEMSPFGALRNRIDAHIIASGIDQRFEFTDEAVELVHRGADQEDGILQV